MFKKASWILIGVTVFSLVFGGVALADEGQPPQAEPGTVRWGGGEVTAVGADNFTLRGRVRGEQVIYVDSNTTLADRELKPLTFADLKAGDRVLGAAKLGEDGKWRALVVYVFPPATNYAGVGTADAVASDSFDFTSRQGKEWEFYVDSDTQIFQGRQSTPLSLDDVETGSTLFVKAEQRDDGKWWATEIRIVPEGFSGGGQRPGGNPNAGGDS